MAHQTSRLKGDAGSSWTGESYRAGSRAPVVGPIQGVTEGASSVLNDAFDLAELQARLVVADSKDFMQTSRLAVLGLVITFALLIASLPVVANGLAQWLAWGLDWPVWVGQLCVGMVLVTGGLLMGLWCVKRLKLSVRAFAASQQEAGENIRWLRQALSRTFSV